MELAGVRFPGGVQTKIKDMTKQDWQYIKDHWGLPYVTIKLKVDEYNVTLQCRQDKMKLVMAVFVNGEIKGKDLLPVSGKALSETEPEWTEVARRFWQTKTKTMHSQKEIKKLERDLGKTFCKRMDIYSKHWYKYPWWCSFNSFKRHIVKHNNNIELVK